MSKVSALDFSCTLADCMRLLAKVVVSPCSTRQAPVAQCRLVHEAWVFGMAGRSLQGIAEHAGPLAAVLPCLR